MTSFFVIRALLLLLLPILIFLTPLPCESTENHDFEHKLTSLTPLVPSTLMNEETKWLLNALEKAHFKKLSIKDTNASGFLEDFISNLDKQKLFFSLPAVRNIIHRFEPTLLTYLQQGNLFPAFEIYDEYRTRALVRIEDVLGKIANNPPLDYNATFVVDRSDGPWASANESLDLVWSHVIANEFINEILSQVDENETLDTSLNHLRQKKKDSMVRLVKKYKRWRKNILDFEAADVQELYLTTLTQRFDPHTSFLNIKEKERFDQAMHNEFVGIGAVLSDEDGFCTIKELLPGGPAEASRELEPEDVILQVAQGEGEFVDIYEMKLSKIVELIKGPKDTLVMLKIRPIKNASSIKTVKIIRDRIRLTGNLANATLHQLKNNGQQINLGVIELPSFYGSNEAGHKATDDVEELIESLKKENIQGLVLDLRRNGGGYLSEAVNLAGLFISRGPIVQVKSSDGKVRKKFDFDPKISWDGPLIVLVSRYSASASEIVAGALKNHRRAIIVGDKSTHGKGTVQSLLPMNIPMNFSNNKNKKSAAKITIQKYYLPSGETTQLTGVASDISLPTVNQYLPIGESDLENALDWDRIPEVNFRRPHDEFTYTQDTLNYLSSNSLKRQDTEPEFSHLNKNINWFREKREQKEVVLNLATRLEQKYIDLNISNSLTNDYNLLSDKSFPSKPLVLNVVKELQEKSLEVRGVGVGEQNSSNPFTKPDNLDIRLHESLRILSDWVYHISHTGLSPKTHSPPDH